MPYLQQFASRRFVVASLVIAVLGTAALTSPAAGASPAPATISPLQVTPGGTQATVTFTTSLPTTVVYAATPAKTTATPAAASQFGLDDVLGPLTDVISSAGTPSAGGYRTQYQLTLKTLQSYTAYDLVVIATTQAGERLTANSRF